MTALITLVFALNGCHHFTLLKALGYVKPMKNKAIIPSLGLIIGIILSLSLTGCWTSVKGSHPLVQKNQSQAHAQVYFIRPRGERFMGMADNRLTISLDRQPLLHLVKAEYTLTRLYPGQTWVSIDNLSTFGPAHRIKELHRSYSFSFAAGKTYYISIDPVDGEFRGVHFTAKALTLAEAQKITPQLRAVGSARWNPIPDTQ